MIKKLEMFLIVTTLLVSLIPGVALAGGGVPAGVTLQSWIVGTASTNVDTKKSYAGISFYYSGGYSTDIELDIPYNASWHKLDDVRPIIEAYKEGYATNLGGSGGIMGTTINFAPNVLAAMKVQNFNPSQVGGADISPSSTTLNSDQIAWLQKMGYSIESTSQSTPSPTTTTASTSTSTSSSQGQAQPQANTSTQATQKATSTPNSTVATTQQSATSPTSTPSTPAVGQTVKTPSGAMTREMVAADQKLSEQNPSSLNPANIPTKVPVKTEITSFKSKWPWIAGSAVIIIFAAALGRKIYTIRRTKRTHPFVI